MLKKNKGKCILSSVIILLPMLVGLLFWNKLPAYMPIHWGIDGTADSIGSKAFAVCGFPAILLAVHWLGMFITAKDPKSAEQTAKAMGMIYWIVPVISLVVNGFMYAAALEAGMDLMMLMPLLLGVMFVVVGNYLPKCKQNHTLGLKLRWTLGNEENWNATHRFGGRVWVAGGFVFLVSAFLPQTVRILVMTVMFIPMVLLPVVYSWRYAGRQIADGRASAEDFRLASRKAEGKTYIALWIGLCILFAFLAVLMLTGSVKVVFGETAFTVEASWSSDLTVEYAAVGDLVLRTEDEPGARVWGFANARLLTGGFRNEEFGRYTRYSHTGCDSCVVVWVGEEVLVLSGRDDAATEELYKALAEKILP